LHWNKHQFCLITNDISSVNEINYVKFYNECLYKHVFLTGRNLTESKQFPNKNSKGPSKNEKQEMFEVKLITLTNILSYSGRIP